jgi:hypothetical protein
MPSPMGLHGPLLLIFTDVASGTLRASTRLRARFTVSLVDVLSVLAIVEMHLKVLDGVTGAGIV